MARITSKQAQELMDAYANVYANKEESVIETPIVEETPLENIQERLSPIQQRIADKRQTQKNLQTATAGYKFSGSRDSSGALSSLRADPVGNKPTPQAAPAPQAGTGSRKVAPGTIGRLLPNHPGNTGGAPQAKPAPQAGAAPQAAPTAQARPAAQAPTQQARPAQAPAQQSGGARAAGERIGGAIGGAVDSGINKAKGGLRALGNLAGRAVGAVKQGVQSGVNTAKRVAGGTADAITGNMTDFDKRGGKPQGLSRVVAGGVDKLTGDRTDLDKRGVTPLNAGQRAQFQKKPAGAPAGAGAAAASAGAAANAAPAPQASPQRQRRDARMAKIKARGNPRMQAQQNRGTPVNQLFQGHPKTGGYNQGPSWTWDHYDPTQDDLFDSTSEFLISEGYAQDINEAISIMSEPEFIEAFTEGYQQVLNEEV